MANQEQLDILKQGVQAWNQWRVEYPGVLPNFTNTYLGGVNIRGANLSEANLNHADLGDADLSETDLGGANLGGANLRGANLSEANLNHAILNYVVLNHVTLSYTTLIDADLNYAYLSGVDLNYAIVGGTSFGDVDLSVVKNLETVRHLRPSTIGIDTIYRSQGKIPETFLRGAGVPDSFIDYIHSLVGKPIDYYSCFISYSSKDEDLAKRLYADLQSNHVRCWFAPEDLKIGAKIRTSIDESIRLHDKLLLLLSHYSVASQWIEHEVERALARERKEEKVILFPIRLDQTVMDIEEGWPALVRNTRNIGDFTQWKRHDAYQKAFTRLLRDLQSTS